MISCTEFIPAYSELFTYLEEHYDPQTGTAQYSFYKL